MVIIKTSDLSHLIYLLFLNHDIEYGRVSKTFEEHRMSFSGQEECCHPKWAQGIMGNKYICYSEEVLAGER